ncbi:YHS domain-containing (seleno)protein [Pseudoalteromonas spongiae]|uniref:YHS domain-containing (seleno)protein n=1 Tax=Pseudoalteromonas spongiae TaxID=298657 RepID=UPI00373673E6
MTFSHSLKTILAVAFIGLSGFAEAGYDTETDKNGVILAGHDVIGYFTEGKPVLGSADFTAVYNDAIYRFKSAENRDLFTQNPEQYAPQYGGFCAYGMTFGKKFEIDGKAFEIVDGKLFVNKNQDVYKAWAKAVPKHISEANNLWPTVELANPSEL